MHKNFQRRVYIAYSSSQNGVGKKVFTSQPNQTKTQHFMWHRGTDESEILKSRRLPKTRLLDTHWCHEKTSVPQIYNTIKLYKSNTEPSLLWYVLILSSHQKCHSDTVTISSHDLSQEILHLQISYFLSQTKFPDLFFFSFSQTVFFQYAVKKRYLET